MAVKTATELFNEMAKKAGFTDDQVKLALSQPEYKELENGYVRHDEYSSALDKAKNLQGKAEQADKWNDWYKTNGPAIQGLNEKAATLARYEERFGALDGTDPDAAARAAAATGLTMADVTKITEQMSQNFSGLLKDGLRIASRHAATFGEELDVDALEKIALEKRVSLPQAYAELVAPRVRDREQEKTKAEIARQVAEGVKDEMSRRALSPGSRGSDIPPSFIVKPTGADAPKDLGDQDLMSMWNDAGKTAAA